MILLTPVALFILTPRFTAFEQPPFPSLGEPARALFGPQSKAAVRVELFETLRSLPLRPPALAQLIEPGAPRFLRPSLFVRPLRGLAPHYGVALGVTILTGAFRPRLRQSQPAAPLVALRFQFLLRGRTHGKNVLIEFVTASSAALSADKSPATGLAFALSESASAESASTAAV